MKKFKGFTLTELMIALAVIGILVAVVTPTIMKTRPNKNKMMIKKAYYTTENIVSSLINDPQLYPDFTRSCSGPTADAAQCSYGFDYTAKATYLGETFEGATKFQRLFGSKLNISGGDADFTTFTTTDGMGWDFSAIKNSPWTKGGAPSGNIRELTIDVNGFGEGPNCVQTACTDQDDFDRFRIRIRSDGKMAINQADIRAAEFITINTSTIH